MARFNFHQNSFLAGEVSPRFWGRTDLDIYRQSCKEITNKLVRYEGGASRRPGTQFIQKNLIDIPLPTTIRFIPFVFSRTEYAMVVLTSLSIFDGAGNATNIFIYDPKLDEFIVPTFTFAAGYKLVQAWTNQDELDQVHYAKSGDVMILTQKKGPPLFIKRTSPTAWTVQNIYNARSIAVTPRTAYTGTDTDILRKLSPTIKPTTSQNYYNLTYRPTRLVGTLTPSATTGGNIDLTLSVGGWTTNYIGTIIRATLSGQTGFVRVKSVSSTTVAKGEVLKTFSAASAHANADVEEQEWGVDANSWPQTCCFFEQRAYYGNDGEKSDTFWGSQIGDYIETMIQRPADSADYAELSNDRPYSNTLPANNVDGIKWMVGGRSSLILGTEGAEWLGFSETDQALGPLNPNFKPQTGYGSKGIQAINYDGSVIFVDKSGIKLREFTFSQDDQAYKAMNLNYYSEHLYKKGLSIFENWNNPQIKEVCMQTSEQEVLWIKDSNGILHAMARERNVNLNACSTMRFGGSLGDEQCKVLTMCLLPSEDGGVDELYLAIQRTIDGTDVVYLEKIGKEFIAPSLALEKDTIFGQPIFSDSCVMAKNVDDMTFFASYRSSINADRGGGTLTGTGTGSPTVADGNLDLTGVAAQYVNYPAAGNVDGLIDEGTIIVKFIPNYDDVPDTLGDQNLVAISQSVASQNNLISIVHQDDGVFYAVIKTSAGASAAIISPGTLSVKQGFEYTAILSFKKDETSYLRVYGNGTNMGGSDTPNGTRTSNMGKFTIGAAFDNSTTSAIKIGEVIVSSSDWWREIEDAAANSGDPLYLFRSFLCFKTITGLSHLEGEDVEVVLDGQYAGVSTPVNGDMDITSEGDRALCGLNYVSRLKTMAIDAGSILGSAQGVPKKIDELCIKFERTVGAKFGAVEESLDAIDFREFQYEDDEPIALFTGDKNVPFPQGYDREVHVIVEQDKPFPCNVTSVVMKGQTND